MPGKAHVILVVTLVLVEAADHHCGNHAQFDIMADSDPEQSERFFPSTSMNDPKEGLGVLRCIWRLSFPIKNDQMLVLRGFDVTKDRRRRLRRSVRAANTNSAKIRYKVMQPKSDGCMSIASLTNSTASCSSHVVGFEESLESTVSFRVLPLIVGSYLSITYAQDSSPQGNLQPPGLMVQLMHKGFCSSDIVSYDERCYRKSESSRMMSEELRFIKGDNTMARLASFKSIGVIRDFVNTSKQTVVGSGDQQRIKIPLGLSQPVRVGLFLERKTGYISYLSTSDGWCNLNEIEDQSTFPFKDLSSDTNRACGSLRVDTLSGREIVEFRNCNESLPALISFSETPMEHFSNCSEPVFNWLFSLMTPDATEGNSSFLRIYTYTVIAAAIATIASIAITIHCCLKRKGRSRQLGTDSEREQNLIPVGAENANKTCVSEYTVIYEAKLTP